MPNYPRHFYDLHFWLALLVLAGCVGGPPLVEPPPWHLQDSGAYVTPAGRVFYGIGQAQGAGNATLLRATAANRARSEMSRVLDLYVSELFQSAGTMPAVTMEEGEQVIGALIRKAAEESVISATHSDPQNAQYHALCQLSLETFKQVLASQARIDDKARSALLSEAERVHALLAGQPFRP